MYYLFGPAHLALDLATPVEDAVAPFDHQYLLRLVTSAAAHEVAAVDADAGVVTGPSVSAQNAEFRVLLAERWRRL